MAKERGSRAGGLAKADRSRQGILDAAARLFRARGYSEVSLRHIAAEAGMKAGSVYYHFESKEAIVLAVLNIGISAVHEEVAYTVDNLGPDASAENILRAAILSHLRSLFEFNDYTSANVRIFHQVPEEIRQANAVARRKYDRLWSDILERIETEGALRASLPAQELRPMLISALNATLDWFDGRSDRLGALADSYAEMLLHGVLIDRGAA